MYSVYICVCWFTMFAAVIGLVHMYKVITDEDYSDRAEEYEEFCRYGY